MDLFKIKEKAELETFDIKSYIKTIEEKRKQYPNGTDIHFPAFIIPRLEAYCDVHEIPFYHVIEETCSTAETYSQLHAHEEQR